jgi:predicted negative regulator of RcsB-dependent stress response
MAKKKGMSKKELRAPDEFQSFILELTEKYGNYWKIALAGLIVIILIPLGITVYNYYKNNQENKAALQYSILLDKLRMDAGNMKLKYINSSLDKFKGTSIYYQVLLLKGKALYDNKKFKDAINVFNEVVSDAKREEFISLAKLDKGLCYFEMNDFKNAKEVLNNLTEDVVVGFDAKYYLALIYEKQNNIVKARSYYQEIVDKAKNYPFYKIAQLKLETL